MLSLVRTCTCVQLLCAWGGGERVFGCISWCLSLSCMLFESDSYTSFAAVANVVTGVALGLGLSLRFMFPYISLPECVAAAAPLGLTLSAWTSIVLKSTVFRATAGLPASMANTGSLLQGVLAAWTLLAVARSWDRRRSEFVRTSVQSCLVATVVLGAVSLWLAYLHYTHSLGKWGDEYFVGGTVYGDMPFHLGVISSFLWGANRCVQLAVAGVSVFRSTRVPACWCPYLGKLFIFELCVFWWRWRGAWLCFSSNVVACVGRGNPFLK